RARRSGGARRPVLVAAREPGRDRQRVQSRALGVGRRRNPAEPPFGDRSRSRLDDRDPLGDGAASASCAARLLGLLGRPVRGRAGLGVMRAPAGAAGAILFQILGWACQILAVYTAMRAFDIHSPLPAAGVVLLLMNVVTIFPFWPGNVGLVQVAIATALVGYGVAYSTGVAYGFGLQAIEASVGIGVGLLFLAREGLSFAMLRVMPTADQAELPAEEAGEDAEE